MGPRGDLDAVAKTKSLPFPYQESNHGRPARSLVTVVTELFQPQQYWMTCTCANHRVPHYVIVSLGPEDICGGHSHGYDTTSVSFLSNESRPPLYLILVWMCIWKVQLLSNRSAGVQTCL